MCTIIVHAIFTGFYVPPDSEYKIPPTFKKNHWLQKRIILITTNLGNPPHNLFPQRRVSDCLSRFCCLWLPGCRSTEWHCQVVPDPAIQMRVFLSQAIYILSTYILYWMCSSVGFRSRCRLQSSMCLKHIKDISKESYIGLLWNEPSQNGTVVVLSFPPT